MPEKLDLRAEVSRPQRLSLKKLTERSATDGERRPESYQSVDVHSPISRAF